MSSALSALWRDPVVRDCYELRRHLLQVQDSAQYFFDNVERIFVQDYIPTKYTKMKHFNKQIF